MIDYYTKAQDIILEAIARGYKPTALIEWNIKNNGFYNSKPFCIFSDAKDFLKAVRRTDPYAKLIPDFNIYYLGTVFIDPKFLKKFFGEHIVDREIMYGNEDILRSEPNWIYLAEEMVPMGLAKRIEFMHDYMQNEDFINQTDLFDFSK